MNKKPIKGFPNYSITQEGVVFSGNLRLKPQFYANGSPFVRLRRSGSYHTFSIAKLVALTFIGEPENISDVVSYKDGNNHNYNIDNLYWTTRSDLFKKLFKEDNRYSETRLTNLKKAVSRPIASYEYVFGNFTKIKEYPSIAEAARELDLTSGSISRCLKNPEARSMGYYWRYLDTEKEEALDE